MTQSGMAICEITVAVNTFSRGEKTASFFDVVAFGKTAEIVNEKTRKGDEVLVDGELKIDRFETKAGEKREKIVISASTVRFSFHSDGQQQAAQPQGQYQQQQPALRNASNTSSPMHPRRNTAQRQHRHSSHRHNPTVLMDLPF